MRNLPRLIAALRHAIIRTAAVNVCMLMATTVTGILVARVLGEYGRGHFASIVAAQGIALVVGEVGQSAAVTFAVSREPDAARAILRASRRIMIPVNLIVTAVACAAAMLFARGDQPVLVAYWLAFGSLLINAVGGPSMYALQALSIDAWNRVRLAQPAAYLLISTALFLTGRLTIIASSAALLLSYLVCMGSAVINERRLRPASQRAEAPVNLLSYGLKQGGSSVPEVLSANLDRVLLLGIVGAPALGQYAVAQSVVSASGPLATAVSSVAFPGLAADQSAGRGRQRREWRIFAGAGLLTATALILFGIISPWVIPLLFGQAFAPAVGLVWLLAPTALLRAFLQVGGMILRGRGAPGLATISSIACLVTTTILLVVLAGRYGLHGAAAATAIGQGAGLVCASLLIARPRPTLPRPDGSAGSAG
ncbi:lipopolysaccharide biosynthesis protein [Enemella evansiae]|uniref:lipopolysaccharide biosynthesis protein n=1 Tax=Enemella evansiae TaxID=2016499 RepID=UPI00105B611D|nr:lipopolysaccharide biosynthesis protein [Enemella evansiae]TDO85335.1 O-antigen/teichoic acid export membrane protein [Enemella evansiae]